MKTGTNGFEVLCNFRRTSFTVPITRHDRGRCQAIRPNFARSGTSSHLPLSSTLADLITAFPSEEQERFVPIVGATPELNVLHDRGTAGGERDDVMQLQKPALCAPALRADKGASTAIPLPYGPADGGRHRSRARGAAS